MTHLLVFSLLYIYFFNGTEKLNIEPSPFFEVNHNLPPFFSTKSWHSNNPRPEPSSLLVPNVVYQDIDVVEVVDGVIDIFNMVAGMKKITIREEKPEKLAVSADIDMLKTVVRNLISNAIKFSNENSEVLVKLEAKDGMAVVSVQDHGCGIDEEGQKKLLHYDTPSRFFIIVYLFFQRN